MAIDPKLLAVVELAQRPLSDGGVRMWITLLVKGTVIIGAVARDSEADDAIDRAIDAGFRQTGAAQGADPGQLEQAIREVQERVRRGFDQASEQIPEDTTLTLTDAHLWLDGQQVDQPMVRVQMSEIDAWWIAST